MDEVRLRAQLGRVIAAHRKARGLTQETLADAVGVSAVWIGQLARGQGLPSLEGLLRLGQALGTDAPTLLDSALDERRREADDELLAELADLDPSAVSVLVSMARVLRERWPRPKGA